MADAKRSSFTDKLMRRQLPTDADWEAHLRGVHARWPSLTPDVFAEFKDPSGRNSYEILAAQPSRLSTSAPQALSALDLGCGDGFFVPILLRQNPALEKVIGIDISPESLTRARTNFKDPRAQFIEARAQSLPLPDHCVDQVFSHLALMLMTPLAPALKEIKRVLKPGGTLTALIPGGAADEMHQKLNRLTALFAQTHLPRYAEARPIDPDLADLIAKCEVQAIHLARKVKDEGVWSYLQGMYAVDMLPTESQKELRGEVLHLAKDFRNAEGLIELRIPCRVLTWRS